MWNISAEAWAVIIAALAFTASNMWKAVELRKHTKSKEADHTKSHVELRLWAKDVDKWRIDVDKKFVDTQQDLRTIFGEIRDILKQIIGVPNLK